MKNYKITESNTEPSKHDIWLKNNSLMKFTNKGWKSIGGSSNAYQAYKNKGGTKTEDEFYTKLQQLIDA